MTESVGRSVSRAPATPTEIARAASGARLGPIGRRLLLAFVLVALSSVVVLTAGALWGTARGVDGHRT